MLYDIQRTPSVDITVIQRPVYVKWECPNCGYKIEEDYIDFSAAHGDPPDWTGEMLECPECGHKAILDDQDWD